MYKLDIGKKGLLKAAEMEKGVDLVAGYTEREIPHKDFINEKPFIANEADCKLSWAGGANGKYFRCYLCGHKFKPGDQVRWVFSNNVKGAGGNPLVCKKCDGTNGEVIEKWKEMHKEVNHKFWWFTKRNG